MKFLIATFGIVSLGALAAISVSSAAQTLTPDAGSPAFSAVDGGWSGTVTRANTTVSGGQWWANADGTVSVTVYISTPDPLRGQDTQRSIRLAPQASPSFITNAVNAALVQAGF